MAKKKTEDVVDTTDEAKKLIRKKLRTKKAKTKKKKKEEPKAKDFQNDLDDFLAATGIQVQTLSEHDQVPYWIHSGSYALNWIISGDMFKGIPGTKVILLSGEEAKGKSLISDAWLGENIRYGGQSIKLMLKMQLEVILLLKWLGMKLLPQRYESLHRLRYLLSKRQKETSKN